MARSRSPLAVTSAARSNWASKRRARRKYLVALHGRFGAPQRLLFIGAQNAAERHRNLFRDFVLDREHILQPLVVALAPALKAVADIHELDRDPQPIAHLAHAAVEHTADSQACPDGAEISAGGPELE